MKTILLFVAALAWLSVFAPEALAQFGAPAQRPGVDQQGTLLLYPSVGIIHEGDAGFSPREDSDIRNPRQSPDEGTSVTDAALVARLRYSIFDDASLSAQMGGVLGDFDAFLLGFGGKYQFTRHTGSLPLDISGFTALDMGLDDATLLTWLVGPLIGGVIETEGADIAPYGGLGVGLTYFKPGATDQGSTEAALGFILGGDFAFSRDFSAYTELLIGATDGLPVLNWHIGVSYALVAPISW